MAGSPRESTAALLEQLEDLKLGHAGLCAGHGGGVGGLAGAHGAFEGGDLVGVFCAAEGADDGVKVDDFGRVA